MELWRLKVQVQRGNLCTAHEQRAFRSFLISCMTGNGNGMGKVLFFSVLLALSWCANNFIQEELFILMISNL